MQFDCDNGVMEIGGSAGVPPFSATVRVGQDARVIIGRNVSTTGTAGISATEGTTVRLGEDCMLAIGVQMRADDGHPIFDVNTGERVNISRDIIVGAHVWIGYNASILGGVSIGSGSVIGLGSVVTKDVPNNAVAAGNPARVVRTDVAWERPHLSLTKPYYKPDASTVTKSRWWARTGEEVTEPAESAVASANSSRWWRRR
ncbi:acyltransferase [Microbacterium sp. NPDC058345]|uniref:acyltransferase n=1 Tax=Microbacterium sp. NPDC058345 TaxID=3346455 RepID=UPI003659D550